MTADEQAIHEIVKQLEEAWNSSDSVSFASHFLEDAQFIQIYGGQMDGRAAIEAAHRAIFDTIYKDSRVAWRVRSVRFIRPEVAIVFTEAHLDFREADQPRVIDARPTLILTRERSRWWIVAVQNTRISEMPARAQAAQRLTS